MRKRNILMIVLAAALGAAALWVAPHRTLAADTKPAGHKVLYYTCPMHSSVRANQPGKCPICGMALRPVYGDTAGTNTPSATVGTNRPAAKMPGCCSPGGCR